MMNAEIKLQREGSSHTINAQLTDIEIEQGITQVSGDGMWMESIPTGLKTFTMSGRIIDPEPRTLSRKVLIV